MRFSIVLMSRLPLAGTVPDCLGRVLSSIDEDWEAGPFRHQWMGLKLFDLEHLGPFASTIEAGDRRATHSDPLMSPAANLLLPWKQRLRWRGRRLGLLRARFWRARLPRPLICRRACGGHKCMSGARVWRLASRSPTSRPVTPWTTGWHPSTAPIRTARPVTCIATPLCPPTLTLTLTLP